MRRLWASVALLALADAGADPLGPPGAYLRSRDFLDVAELAGLDGTAAQGRMREGGAIASLQPSVA